VDAITKGEKKYEFRKVIFRKGSVNTIFIYSSSPIKKIVGCFSIGTILRDDPKSIWEKVSEESGISEEDYFQYFRDRNIGYAIEIKDLQIFPNPIDPSSLPSFFPPQSFQYMNDLTFPYGNQCGDASN